MQSEHNEPRMPRLDNDASPGPLATYATEGCLFRGAMVVSLRALRIKKTV